MGAVSLSKHLSSLQPVSSGSRSEVMQGSTTIISSEGSLKPRSIIVPYQMHCYRTCNMYEHHVLANVTFFPKATSHHIYIKHTHIYIYIQTIYINNISIYSIYIYIHESRTYLAWEVSFAYTKNPFSSQLDGSPREDRLLPL